MKEIVQKTSAHVITLTKLRVKFAQTPCFAINFAIFQLDVMCEARKDGNVRELEQHMRTDNKGGEIFINI